MTFARFQNAAAALVVALLAASVFIGAAIEPVVSLA
jgi:hypothetical protein